MTSRWIAVAACAVVGCGSRASSGRSRLPAVVAESPSAALVAGAVPECDQATRATVLAAVEARYAVAATTELALTACAGGAFGAPGYYVAARTVGSEAEAGAATFDANGVRMDPTVAEYVAIVGLDGTILAARADALQLNAAGRDATSDDVKVTDLDGDGTDEVLVTATAANVGVVTQDVYVLMIRDGMLTPTAPVHVAYDDSGIVTDGGARRCTGAVSLSRTESDMETQVKVSITYVDGPRVPAAGASRARSAGPGPRDCLAEGDHRFSLRNGALVEDR